MKFIRPIRRHVLLLDDQPGPERVGNVEVLRPDWACAHLDYLVVKVGTDENVDFGQGDIAILGDPGAGRRVKINGTVYRLVKTTDIIAIKEN